MIESYPVSFIIALFGSIALYTFRVGRQLQKSFIKILRLWLIATLDKIVYLNVKETFYYMNRAYLDVLKHIYLWRPPWPSG